MHEPARQWLLQSRKVPCLILLWALQAAPGSALELGEFSAATLQGDGWRAEQVSTQLEFAADGALKFRLNIARLQLERAGTTLTDVSLVCSRLLLESSTLGCRASRIRVGGLPLDAVNLQADWEYDLATAAGFIHLSRVRIAGGELDVRIRGSLAGWQAQLLARSLSLGGLQAASERWIAAPWPAGFDGRLDGDFTLQGAAGINRVAGRLRLYEVNGSNPEGTLAGEHLAMQGQFSAHRNGGNWQANFGLEESSGQAYVHPVFVDLEANPASGSLQINQLEGERARLDFQLRQRGIGELAGQIQLVGQEAAVESWHAHVSQAQLPDAYLTYLQPFLIGTPADSLETVGAFDARLSYADHKLQEARLSLRDVHLDDTRGRFALYGLDGNIDWHARDMGNSALSWAGGYLYNVGLGPAQLPLESGAGLIGLTRGVRIPVLDGQLAISRFRLEHVESTVTGIEFDADIEGIGLRALTRSLGWPPFAGSLSGSIPRMKFADDIITVDGALVATVFGGSIRLESLRVSEPFGVLPQVEADIRLRGLDLAAITSTFSFGSIEGRLDGDFDNFRMLGFSPVAFNARLYTTPGDRSRHRISQQAIENISDLGGAGAAAVLSRGLLRFFEAFAYDEIGWSCRLRDEVCLMDGVEPAPGNGYYIVKGKGLPRINVIGFSRRVSWPRLLEKLRDIKADNISTRP